MYILRLIGISFLIHAGFCCVYFCDLMTKYFGDLDCQKYNRENKTLCDRMFLQMGAFQKKISRGIKKQNKLQKIIPA